MTEFDKEFNSESILHKFTNSENTSAEATSHFELRKADHIRLALDEKTQSRQSSDFERVELIHEALPEINFREISLHAHTLGEEVDVPLFISSMTAGHKGSFRINEVLAECAAERGWLMGVGSQRRELFDLEAREEWRKIRDLHPDVNLIGNIGLAQLIETPHENIEALVDVLEAKALFVHTNPLQESLQPEGTTEFKGGLQALERLCADLSVPVILKETGCGFSASTLIRLQEVGLAVVDISGLGGTHWGRIEGYRSDVDDLQYEAAQTFKNWGIGTLESLIEALKLDLNFELWASGGVRSGLDAAKCLAIGAQMVGFAQPLLKAALLGPAALLRKMELLELELKIALFCTGCQNIAELQEKNVWQIKKW